MLPSPRKEIQDELCNSIYTLPPSSIFTSAQIYTWSGLTSACQQEISILYHRCREWSKSRGKPILDELQPDVDFGFSSG